MGAKWEHRSETPCTVRHHVGGLEAAQLGFLSRNPIDPGELTPIPAFLTMEVLGQLSSWANCLPKWVLRPTRDTDQASFRTLLR